MKKSTWIGLLLLLFVALCRMFTPVAEFYAGYCYPVISVFLSWPASVFPFSLEEITVAVFVLLFVRLICISIRRRQGLFNWLKRTVLLIMWLVVWFYMGWGNNYFRKPLYERAGVERSSFQKERFDAFLADYTRELNRTAGASVGMERSVLEQDINTFYCGVPSSLGYTGLHRWQRTKRPLLNSLYSAVSVLGYMGPFWSESQLNLDLQESEYASVLAHEKAHLAGVTSEAEANYWSYEYCRQSADDGVRYSGCLSLLPYVMINAGALCTDEEYDEWIAGVSPIAIDDYKRNHEHWRQKRVRILDEIQSRMMDSYLKSNNISQGADDYIGVVGMIITMDY